MGIEEKAYHHIAGAEHVQEWMKLAIAFAGKEVQVAYKNDCLLGQYPQLRKTQQQRLFPNPGKVNLGPAATIRF
jgi:hypothetical protein